MSYHWTNRNCLLVVCLSSAQHYPLPTAPDITDNCSWNNRVRVFDVWRPLSQIGTPQYIWHVVYVSISITHYTIHLNFCRMFVPNIIMTLFAKIDNYLFGFEINFNVRIGQKNAYLFGFAFVVVCTLFLSFLFSFSSFGYPMDLGTKSCACVEGGIGRKRTKDFGCQYFLSQQQPNFVHLSFWQTFKFFSLSLCLYVSLSPFPYSVFASFTQVSV